MGSSRRSARATLAQVADLAGVSVMTASYTYNQPRRVSDEARTRVLEAAAKLGYAGPDPSARSLRRGSTQTLGIVLGEHLSYAFDDPQATSFLAGIADICAELGYGMTVLPITGGADDVQRVRAAAVDGFVIWTTSDDDPVLETVRELNRPAVVHGGPAFPGLGLVGIDDRAAARAIGAVAFAGARRPAVMSFPLSRERISTIAVGTDITDVSFPVTRARLEGYRRAAEDSGIGWGDVVVAVAARNDANEATRLAAELLSSPDPPDAIAAMSDEQAAGVVQAARAADVAVPGDLAITGWDDATIASELDLTTVAQSLRAQGAQCARAALDQGVDFTPGQWSVVVRGSTRA